MKATKKDVKKLLALHAKAVKALQQLEAMEEAMQRHIHACTGVNGYIDFLKGDGFGFTPDWDGDTHVIVTDLCKELLKGIDIEDDETLKDMLVY